MTDNRLTLTMLGDRLAAGKTIWLRHQLHEGLRAHVITNEAAGVVVDDALLSRAHGVEVPTRGLRLLRQARILWPPCTLWRIGAALVKWCPRSSLKPAGWPILLPSFRRWQMTRFSFGISA